MQKGGRSIQFKWKKHHGKVRPSSKEAVKEVQDEQNNVIAVTEPVAASAGGGGNGQQTEEQARGPRDIEAIQTTCL